MMAHDCRTTQRGLWFDDPKLLFDRSGDDHLETPRSRPTHASHQFGRHPPGRRASPWSVGWAIVRAVHVAPYPARGTFAEGYEPVARVFAEQLARGEELGASFALYRDGRRVIDLWGGSTSADGSVPWNADTRVVVYSVTKGLASMGLALLSDRGLLDWDAPVASVWPEFAQAGKSRITFRALFNHQAGLAVLDEPFTLAECADPKARPRLVAALERQRPRWRPGEDQGYHATTFGMFASEVFERLAGEPLGPFLERELFAPLEADVALGTPAEDDHRISRVFEPTVLDRAKGLADDGMLRLRRTHAHPWFEGRVVRALLEPKSLVRGAFMNPRAPGMESYATNSVWRAALAWASATATADGIARAYLPFALGGEFEGRRFLKATTLSPIYERQGWSERDRVLQKPLGWSQGFLKEEPHFFSPTRESFGHAGMGGALGWCDPVHRLSFGYAPNRLDRRVRSPRAVALAQAIYTCEPIRDHRP